MDQMNNDCRRSPNISKEVEKASRVLNQPNSQLQLSSSQQSSSMFCQQNHYHAHSLIQMELKIYILIKMCQRGSLSSYFYLINFCFSKRNFFFLDSMFKSSQRRDYFFLEGHSFSFRDTKNHTLNFPREHLRLTKGRLWSR